MSWLWNSKQPEINGTCIFLTTAREIWEAAKQAYPKAQDASQMYETKTKITATKQGNLSIIKYHNTMKSLWHELDYYQNFKMKSGEDAAMMQKLVRRRFLNSLLVLMWNMIK